MRQTTLKKAAMKLVKVVSAIKQDIESEKFCNSRFIRSMRHETTVAWRRLTCAFGECVRST